MVSIVTYLTCKQVGILLQSLNLVQNAGKLRYRSLLQQKTKTGLVRATGIGPDENKSKSWYMLEQPSGETN